MIDYLITFLLQYCALNSKLSQFQFQKNLKQIIENLREMFPFHKKQ